MIQVTKTENLEFANTNLETLAIENGLLTPSFNNTITEYNVEISNSITNLKLLAIPENENGKVEISGNDSLKEGKNIVNILVTAPNGTTKRNYKIIVYKRNSDEENKYKIEKEKQKEKIEEAYEVEKLSTSNNIKSEEDKSSQTRVERSKNYLTIIVILIIVIFVIFAVFYYIRYRT